jgi:predicted GIY-YIG superfamily endonuclease
MSFWVYILRCADGSYYTGHTDNLEKRVAEHQAGEVEGYTSTRLPVTLVFSQEFPSREEALACERQIKGWSRKKKEALLRSDWVEMSRLAHRHGRHVGD